MRTSVAVLGEKQDVPEGHSFCFKDDEWILIDYKGNSG